MTRRKLPISAIFHTGRDAVRRIVPTLRRTGDLEIEVIGSASVELRDQIGKWAVQYATGQTPSIQLPLYLSHLDTFTQQILRALYEVPYGKTLTYLELAALAGRPLAARPAGMACKRNPLPLVIPCHRVVNTRELGKYAYGVAMKRRLLMHEGALRLI